MQDAKLIAMANQIAGYFRPYPPAEAAAGVKRHLVSFWTPAMLATLKARIARDRSGLDPLVVRAMAQEASPS